MTKPPDIALSNHARERIPERLDATVQDIKRMVDAAYRERRFSRHKPKWLQRYYGTARRAQVSADQIRYVRFVDAGYPACIVVSVAKERNRLVVVTVIREDERTRGMQEFHASFTSADRRRPGDRARHRARFRDRGDDQ